MTSWGRGKYGATGGQLVAAQFDRMTGDGFFKSSPDSERGFEARLTYVLKHGGGGEALHAAGVKADKSRVTDWLTGDIKPSRKTRAGVDAAYRQLRRQNLARKLKGRLSRKGTGTRITVEPLPASEVPADRQVRQGMFDDREINVRAPEWNALVDAWADGDDDALDDAWMDVADDLGSPPEAYYEVSHVGFSA